LVSVPLDILGILDSGKASATLLPVGIAVNHRKMNSVTGA